MSNVYIRSQNREKLYIFGISFNSLQYEEQHDYKRGKEAATHHTICIADGCLEEIAEYESKERCIEVLDEIEKVCSSYTEGIPYAGEVRTAHGRIQRGSKRVLPSIQTITEKAQLAYAQQI